MQQILPQRIKRRLIIFFLTIIASVIVLLACLSPIAKYLVEKYDEQYTGRKITMDWAYVNPFTGYVHFTNLKVYELNSDSIFISVNGLCANLAVTKLLVKTYEISELMLNQPKGFIIQDSGKLNFDDLLLRFFPKKHKHSLKGPVHFSMPKINILNGAFYFREKTAPINYSIRQVNMEISGMHWNVDTISSNFSFLSDTGNGFVKGEATINTKTNDYRLAAVVQKFDLKIIGQYLMELSNYGNFSASLDADIKARGNFLNQENINVSGIMSINDLHLGKSKTEDYASFDKLTLAIIQLNPKDHKYDFDSVSLRHPYLKYERYDHLDNFQNMFGKEGSNIATAYTNPTRFNLIIEIGNYIKILSKNFFNSDYKINKVAVYEGDAEFNDYSVGEKFSISFHPFTIVSDSIDKNRKRAEVSFNSGILPYGNVNVTLSINPKDSGDFDVRYNLQKVPVSMFNPYIVFYTSFPLDRGTISLNGEWNVRNSIIKSRNHILIIDPRASHRIKNKELSWMPLPLLFSFIRERGNVIDYEVPINGNLRNPRFHLKDVIFDMFGNILIKPVTTPYRITVRNTETEIEKSLVLKWETRQGSIYKYQNEFIEAMATFLETYPSAVITVEPQLYSLKEEESILFYEAKKKYFMSVNHLKHESFSENDSNAINKMSIKDSLFIFYLNGLTKGQMLFTIQDKCAVLINSKMIDIKMKTLSKERHDDFLSYFKEKHVVNRIRILPPKQVIPYNGYSFYKISYSGELPENLLKAYKRMNTLNDGSTRKKYKKTSGRKTYMY